MIKTLSIIFCALGVAYTFLGIWSALAMWPLPIQRSSLSLVILLIGLTLPVVQIVLISKAMYKASLLFSILMFLLVYASLYI